MTSTIIRDIDGVRFKVIEAQTYYAMPGAEAPSWYTTMVLHFLDQTTPEQRQQIQRAIAKDRHYVLPSIIWDPPLAQQLPEVS